MDYKFDEKKHIHSFKDKPLCGTSTVMGVVAKPLTWWASGLAVAKLGWINSKIKVNGKYTTIALETRLEALQPQHEAIKAMSNEEFLTLLDEAYKAHSVNLKDTAQAGTDLHAELEKYVKNWMLCHDPKNKGGDMINKTVYDKKIEPFIKWANENVKKFLWSEAHCYSEKLWCGGISDAGAELNDGTIAIIDFKSAKDAYTGHFIQCAGYAIEIEENGLFDSTGTHTKKIDGTIGALVVVPFGAKEVYPVIMRDVDAHKKAFEAAVVLYRLMFNSKE